MAVLLLSSKAIKGRLLDMPMLLYYPFNLGLTRPDLMLHLFGSLICSTALSVFMQALASLLASVLAQIHEI